jgi:hypothetical protein
MEISASTVGACFGHVKLVTDDIQITLGSPMPALSGLTVMMPRIGSDYERPSLQNSKFVSLYPEDDHEADSLPRSTTAP